MTHNAVSEHHRTSKQHLYALTPVLFVQELSCSSMINVVWALAKTDYNGNGSRRSRMLLDNIAKSAMVHLEDFSPEQLSRLLWSYSTLHHYVKPLFDAVATEVLRQVSGPLPQQP